MVEIEVVGPDDQVEEGGGNYHPTCDHWERILMNVEKYKRVESQTEQSMRIS